MSAINGRQIINLWINGDFIDSFSDVKAMCVEFKNKGVEFPSNPTIERYGSSEARKKIDGEITIPYKGKMYLLRFTRIKPLEKARKKRVDKS